MRAMPPARNDILLTIILFASEPPAASGAGDLVAGVLPSSDNPAGGEIEWHQAGLLQRP